MLEEFRTEKLLLARPRWDGEERSWKTLTSLEEI